MSYSYKQELRQSLTVARTAYLALMALAPNSAYQSIGGVPLAVAFPVAVGAATVISDMSKQFVLDYIPGNKQYASAEGALVTAGLTGGATAGLLKIADRKGDIGGREMFNIALLGIGSEIGGTYLWDRVLQPSLQW